MDSNYLEFDENANIFNSSMVTINFRVYRSNYVEFSITQTNAANESDSNTQNRLCLLPGPTYIGLVIL